MDCRRKYCGAEVEEEEVGDDEPEIMTDPVKEKSKSALAPELETGDFDVLAFAAVRWKRKTLGSDLCNQRRCASETQVQSGRAKAAKAYCSPVRREDTGERDT